jgi:hypothetical protein
MPSRKQTQTFYVRNIDADFMRMVEEYLKIRFLNKSDFVVDCIKYFIANLVSTEKPAWTQATRNIVKEVERKIRDDAKRLKSPAS